MNDFLSKPVDPEVLAALVRRWISVPGTPAGAQGSSAGATDPRLVALEGVEGLDWRGGLRRCADRVDLYLGLLRRFAQDLSEHAHTLAQKRAGLPGDGSAGAATEALRRQLHSLRGVAGNLGATLLHRQCETAEQLLRSGAGPADDAVSGVEATARQLGDGLLAALGPDGGPDVTAAGPGVDVPVHLPELAALLRGGDAEAVDWVDRHQAALLAQLGPDGAQLATQVRRFDYDQALAILQAHVPAGR